MKRLLFLLLLFPSLAWGQVSTSGVSLSGCSTGGGAAACTTSTDSKLEYPVTQPGTTHGGDSTWNALKIVLDATTTITSYKCLVCDKGSDAGTVVTRLYNDDGNGATSKPTTEVASSSKSLATSTFTDCTGESVIDFDLATPLQVSAGTYWIVSTEVDAANRDSLYVASAGDRICYSSNGSDWTCGNDSAYDMELWGCQ